MLKPQAHQCFSSQPSIFPKKTSLLGYGRREIPFKPRTTATPTQRITKGGVRVVHCHCRNMKATTTEQIETLVNVKAQVTVKIPSEGLLSKLSLTAAVASLTDLLGKTLMLELYSSDLDPETGLQKQTVKGYGNKVSSDEEEVLFECIFDVPDDFGQVGAVIVENRHNNEIFLKDMVLNGLSDQPLRISCNSWVASKFDNQEKRIFFVDKSYLPSETPSGLKNLREEELNYLQGNGKGERKSSDRIYDYDKYNDLGDPDSSEELARPVLGGPDRPYPRRCRTGRPATKKDPMSESPQFGPYVPRDEDFSAEKLSQFSGTTLKQVLNAVLPSITNILIDSDLGFPNFRAIDNLFEEGFNMPKIENKGLLQNLLPRLFEAVSDGTDALLRFDTPELINRDKFSWLKDEEFSRQTLAGVNPYSIQLVTEWPLKSKLDPTIYGPAESSITKELIERQIKGVMTVDEALKQKKLFVLDYHDLLLPYVQKVRELNGTTLYGSRTLFFLTHKSTLRPIAIELTRPSMDDKPFWRHVYSTGFDSTDNWLWMFAKVHVCAHDSGYHELVSHWLRTHCCVEPYIIASHRQLSAMHPIFKLLHPHLRFTMEINALARSALINAGGIIERAFSPAKYSMELSSAAYDQMWRFDMEALPADLIRRGMAVEDPTEKHGLKLTIKDYPFANDGLLVWDAIKIWITDYVNHYYPESSLVETDKELQAWWDEIRTKGHEDKKDEPWWPVLNTQESLIQILSTIVWVASCHHAAVNFGQYTYGGYFPNRPAIARTNMPNEEGKDSTINKFLEKPESVLLECFPTQLQATVVMAILNVLSSHSSDEEYLGALPQTAWSDNPVIKAAYEQFSKRLMDVERVIDERNADVNLINRTGAGVVPYELLKLSSEAGVTGKGVPNSISI